jgi:hypothetical protein
MFWTWLWGPLGFVLSTPLTVCLVVLARHTDRLKFFEVLLRSSPALSPPERFYQRMLAGDPDEATLQAEQVLKDARVSKYYDEIVLPGLQLALQDAERGLVGGSRLVEIKHSIEAMLENLSEYKDLASDEEAESERTAEVEQPVAPLIPPEWRRQAVLCVAGRSPLDEAASKIMAQLLHSHGIEVTTLTYDDLSRDESLPVLHRRQEPYPQYAVHAAAAAAEISRCADSDRGLDVG